MSFNFQNLVVKRDKLIGEVHERYADEIVKRAMQLKGKKVRLRYAHKSTGGYSIHVVKVKDLAEKSSGYTDLFQTVTAKGESHPVFADTDITILK